MAKFSVSVCKKENCDFFKKIFNEIGNEINDEICEDKVVFNIVDDRRKERIYDVLAKKIFEDFSKKILIKIINTNCNYLSKPDKYEIWKIAFKYIMNDMIENNYEHLCRMSIIKKRLTEFCDNSECICIDGFVNFRLRELEQNFSELVEESVQEYMIELEYIEFINMLKYFVSIQIPLFLSVEVIYGDKIKLYADGKDITYKCIKDFNKDICFSEDRDDFLLNSLISISPKKIVIRQVRQNISNELKKTLLGVFGDKLKIITE